MNNLKILIPSILVITLSLAGCIGNESNTGSTVETDSDIVYPNSKVRSDVPQYYYNIIGIATDGITLSIYECDDEVEDILNWYKNKLIVAGYEIAVNTTVAKISGPFGTIEYGMIIFKKGNNAIGIWAMREPFQERTIYFVGKGPVDKLLGSTQTSESTETESPTPPTNNEVGKPQLPSLDKTSGEEPIERYPDSVMLEHTVITGGGKKYIYIKYGTDRDPEEVFKWYKENIRREGWNIIYTASDGDIYYLTCGRSDRNELVTITVEKNRHTIINVEYVVAGE